MDKDVAALFLMGHGSLEPGSTHDCAEGVAVRLVQNQKEELVSASTCRTPQVVDNNSCTAAVCGRTSDT